MSSPRRVRISCLLLLLFLFIASAHGGEGQTLRWKFAVGEPLDYAIEQWAVTTVNVEGVEFTARSRQTLDVNWTVDLLTPDGTATILQQVRRIRLDVHAPRAGGGALGDLQYDSAEGREGNGRIWDALKPVLLALPESKFTLHVTPLGEVQQVQFSDNLAEAIKKLPSAPIFTGGNMLSEEGLRQMIELAVQTLPEQAVAEGGTWSRKVERRIPNAGAIVIDLTNEMAGAARLGDRECVQFGLKSESRYEPPAKENPDVSLELGESSGSGTVHFDTDSGRTLASRFRQKLLVTGDFRGASFTQEIATRLSVTLAGCEQPDDEADQEDD